MPATTQLKLYIHDPDLNPNPVHWCSELPVKCILLNELLVSFLNNVKSTARIKKWDFLYRAVRYEKFDMWQ